MEPSATACITSLCIANRNNIGGFLIWRFHSDHQTAIFNSPSNSLAVRYETLSTEEIKLVVEAKPLKRKI